ncbi:hypothetical protein [Helicobacter gastrocanis]|uniref:hypothetical protein n=1 Tax=Helicobacter gastrocanis TaxID=2849641 RepID=UPI001C84968A|nr:hypothetical protein [Helicobacter sp. NHP19-003]
MATILGMQRGVDKRKSGVKRIEPRAYAKLMEKSKGERKELKAKYQRLVKKDLNELKVINKTYASLFKQLEIRHVENFNKESLNGLSDTEKINITTTAYLEAVENKINTLKQQKLEAEKSLAELIDNAPKGKKAHTLIEGARKIWANLNKGLKEINLSEFEAEDYKALRELKKKGLTIDGLKARITELEDLAESRFQEKLKLEVAQVELNADFKKLQSKHNSALADITLLKFGKEGLQDQINDLVKEKQSQSKDYKLTIQGLQTTNKELSKQIESVAALKAKAQELDTKSNSLAKDLATKSDVIRKALENVQSLHATNKEQAESLASLQKDYKEVLKANQSLSTRHTDDLTKIKELEESNTNLQKQINALNKAPQAQEVPKQKDIAPKPSQADYDALKRQYDDAQENLRQAQEKIDDLEYENTKLGDALIELETKHGITSNYHK